jgi:hypothetical protein
MASPCPAQPACGSQGDSTDDVLTIILAIVGVGGTVIGIISTLVGGVAITVILGIAAANTIWLGGAAGAAAVIATTFGFWYSRCLSNPDGPQMCSAGVVTLINTSFGGAEDYVFPFVAQHDVVQVVVKCIYWPLVAQTASYIYCAAPDNSPEFFCMYENKAVCPTEAGAFIGAVVGGVAGLILGVIVGAAIGCAATGPFYLFCLLIAALIACIIAAVCALIGAFAGGNIAHAIAGDSDPSTDAGDVIHSGDYITTKGKTIISGDFNHARIYRFVEHTTAHGHSTGAGPWFSHTDPDANLIPDACPVGTTTPGGTNPSGPAGGPPPPK